MTLPHSRRAATACSAITVVALALLLSFVAVGVAAASETVKASSGAFETVLPHGFADRTAEFSGSAVRLDLVIAAPASDGFAVNVNVVRERVKTTNVTAVAEASLAYIKNTTRAHAFSPLQTLGVDGATARAFDYLTSASNGTRLHQRQVYVIHAGWAYVITYSALSGSQYQGSLSAFRQVLAGWRWL
jgi:DcrB